MFNLIAYPKNEWLSEIFQSLDLKFAFVNENNEQVNMPCKCRDFLGDCLWSKAVKQSVNIYGFKYDYSVSPYDEKILRLSIKFPDGDTYNNFMANISYLHEKEKQAKVRRTKVYQTQEKDTIVVEASKFWQDLPWKLALYTYYIKVISLPNPNEVTVSPEISYKNTIVPMEPTLLSWVKKKVKYTWHDTISGQHNYSGVISMCKKQNKIMELYQ